jgi:hypothetical protein
MVRKLKEFLGNAEIGWVDNSTLRIKTYKKYYEYEITIKCETDVSCSTLRKLTSLIDFLSLLS